jgi:hypothetical protein
MICLWVILGLITFTINVSIGLALKARTLLIRNVLFYPFGIVVAEILNMVSLKWTYAENNSPVGFGIINGLGLFCFYILAFMFSITVLGFFVKYETSTQNPISSYSYYLKSSKKNTTELLQSFIRKLRNVYPTIVEEKERTWMKFNIDPNDYAIAFVPRNEHEAEVNILSCQTRSDMLCEAEKEEAELIDSMINALFTTWKKQGYVDEWRTENSPQYAEESRDALLKEYTATTKFPVGSAYVKKLRYNMVEWTKRNREIIRIIVTAIISPIVVYLIIHFFFNF